MSQANTVTAEKSSENASSKQKISGLFVVGSLGFESRTNGDVSRSPSSHDRFLFSKTSVG
jgi:hypothetical protein